MDKETQEIYQEGEAVSEFIKTRAWGLVKSRLENKIADLDSVRNVAGKTPEEIAQDVLARQAAVEILKEFLIEVDGMVEAHKMNKDLTEDIRVI